MRRAAIWDPWSRWKGEGRRTSGRGFYPRARSHSCCSGVDAAICRPRWSRMRRRKRRTGVRRPGVSHPDSMLQTSSVMLSEGNMQKYSDRTQQTLSGCQGRRSAASTSRSPTCTHTRRPGQLRAAWLAGEGQLAAVRSPHVKPAAELHWHSKDGTL